MLRAHDPVKRPGEGGLRYRVQQVPGDVVHEFPSEALAKSAVLGLYQRWQKSRAFKPEDYPECKALLIDSQAMSVLIYSFNDRSIACAPSQSFLMTPIEVAYPGGQVTLRPPGLMRRR